MAMNQLLLSLMLGSALTPGGMRLVAKAPPAVFVSVAVRNEPGKPAVFAKDAVQTEVEAGLRRCGFRIAEQSETPTVLFVNVSPLNHGRLGTSASVLFVLNIIKEVEGELAFVNAYTDGMSISSPPGHEWARLHATLDQQLDELCRQFQRAKTEVASGQSGK
jgi:hypothetical protein